MLLVSFNLVITAEYPIEIPAAAPIRNCRQHLYHHLFPAKGNYLFFPKTGPAQPEINAITMNGLIDVNVPILTEV